MKKGLIDEEMLKMGSRHTSCENPNKGPVTRLKTGQNFLQILSKTTWIYNKLAILASFLNICDQWDLNTKAGKIGSVSHEPNLLVKMKF